MSSSQNYGPKWYYYAMALIAPFNLSINYVLSKYLMHDISPIALALFRWLGTLILLTPFVFKLFIKEFNILRANVRMLTIMSITGIAYTYITFFAARYTTSTNAAIINSIFPVIVLTLDIIINKQRLQIPQAFAVLFAFMGVVIIVSQGNILQGLKNLFQNVGDFIALIGTIFWATYVFVARLKPDNLSSFTLVYSITLVGVACMLPTYLFEIWYMENIPVITIKNISIIGAIVSVNVFGVISLNISVAKIGANLYSILFYTAPLFTAIMAILVLGEQFEYFHFIGILTILFGINIPLFVSLLKKKRTKISSL